MSGVGLWSKSSFFGEIQSENRRFLAREKASSLFRVKCGFISHLSGRETVNIPEIFSGVHSFTGKTVKKSE